VGEKGQKGEEGSKGDLGPTGAGEKGQKGEEGSKGDLGPTGVGEKGQKGEEGSKGDLGPTGAGQKGQKGEEGSKGDLGPTGVGEKGQKGEEGSKGDLGPTGAGQKGQKGEEGSKGDLGPTGIGEKGQKGEEGDKGDLGPTGVGEKGQKGEEGDKGDLGPTGSKGEVGPTLVSYDYGVNILPSNDPSNNILVLGMDSLLSGGGIMPLDNIELKYANKTMGWIYPTYGGTGNHYTMPFGPSILGTNGLGLNWSDRSSFPTDGWNNGSEINGGQGLYAVAIGRSIDRTFEITDKSVFSWMFGPYDGGSIMEVALLVTLIEITILDL